MVHHSISLPLAFVLLSLVPPSVDGQTVDDCRCKGSGHSHGQCGYHLHFGSNDNKPWCRTLNRCGTNSLKGSWSYCDARGVERRYANDGQLYNVKEFQTHSGADGADKWKAAKLYVERRVALDTRVYSAADLRAHYVDSWGEQGWLRYWDKATAEQRKAADGKWYDFKAFINYDPANGWKQWADASGSSGAVVTGEEGSKRTLPVAPDGCQCNGKGTTNGHCGYHFSFGSSGDKPWCRTLSSCGKSSMLGSWSYCDNDSVERRRIMFAHGDFLTAKDLRQSNIKNGAKAWKDASILAERRMAGSEAYDVHEFRAYYIISLGEKGWLEKWRMAGAEQRKANDGEWYTWEQFGEYYGDKAVQMWEPRYGQGHAAGGEL